jgi:hypothetical protein
MVAALLMTKATALAPTDKASTSGPELIPARRHDF